MQNCIPTFMVTDYFKVHLAVFRCGLPGGGQFRDDSTTQRGRTQAVM